LIVCAEVQHTLLASHSHYLGVPGDPRMAVVPFFREFSEHQRRLPSESSYVFGQPTKFGVPGPLPIFSTAPYYTNFVSHRYQEGSVAIVRFNASDWPAAQNDITSMARNVLRMEYIWAANRISARRLRAGQFNDGSGALSNSRGFPAEPAPPACPRGGRRKRCVSQELSAVQIRKVFSATSFAPRR
jgi:hypothetical protein